MTWACAALLAAGALPGKQAQAGNADESPLTVGGAIRFNYVQKSWQDGRKVESLFLQHRSGRR